MSVGEPRDAADADTFIDGRPGAERSVSESLRRWIEGTRLGLYEYC